MKSTLENPICPIHCPPPMHRKPTLKAIGRRPLQPDELARLGPPLSESRIQPLLRLAVPMVS
jgi:hypothetical protein